MIKTLLLSLFSILLISSVNAQKVKIKNGLASVDGTAYAQFDECNGQICTITSMTDQNVLVIQWESFEKKNPIKRNPKSKAPYHETVTERYTVIKFLEIEIEIETQLTGKKQIIKALYNNGVIDSEGNVSVEKAELFARKYGQKISGNRPIVIIIE